MRTTGQVGALPVQQQFEDLASSYRSECQRGIPMSVHERYELRMSRLRQELRARKTSCYLGDVLKRMGVIDERQLSHALEIQTEDGRNKLLGEILVDLGWVDEASIRRAVSIQGSGSETEEKRNGEGGQQAKRRLSCET